MKQKEDKPKSKHGEESRPRRRRHYEDSHSQSKVEMYSSHPNGDYYQHHLLEITIAWRKLLSLET